MQRIRLPEYPSLRLYHGDIAKVAAAAGVAYVKVRQILCEGAELPEAPLVVEAAQRLTDLNIEFFISLTPTHEN